MQSSIADNCNGIQLGFSLPKAKDDCSLPFVQQIEGLKTGSIFPNGLNVLTFEALDNNGKKSTCRMEINVSPVQLLNVDNVSACINETLNLQGKTFNDVVYLWRGPDNFITNNSSLSLPITSINQKGQYILTATFNNKCIIKDTVTVNVNNAPKVLNDSFVVAQNGTLTGNVLKNDVLLNGVNFTVKIKNDANNGTLNIKNDGTITYNPTTGYKGADNFSYEVCTTLCPNTCPKATVFLTISEVSKEAYIVNEIITPNGDGFNDALIIEDFDANSPNNKSSIIIYSQWGEVVYKAAPYMNNWSGTYKELPLPEGTYYFIFKPSATGEPSKSFITIIR
jgi:gliding motility-associated-like protein